MINAAMIASDLALLTRQRRRSSSQFAIADILPVFIGHLQHFQSSGN